MTLDKILRKIMMILSIATIVACSSNKNSGTNRSIESSIKSEVAMVTKNSVNSSSEGQIYEQIQELQQSSIIYFDLDKYNIRPEFIATLDAHANFLRDNPSYRIVIEGHADERGTPEYNISLGERRANAVKMYLQSKGIFEDQISIVSYGKEKPAMLGHNEAIYAKNRRAVLIY